MTDFRKAQESARRRTWLLWPLYLVVMAGVICMIYSALAGFWFFETRFSDLRYFWYTASALAALMIGGSLYKVWQLKDDGGEDIAIGLGGVEVKSSTGDQAERRLYNIVEEMSIASQIDMPAIYVLRYEQGINALSAGYDADDAAIIVTEGALHLLKRDELQAIVAHAFGSVLNGHMRMNTITSGALHGLLMISEAGNLCFKVTKESCNHHSDTLPFFAGLLGCVLRVAGSCGVIGGRLIKAAIVRQNAATSDALAVEFTRNPEALAGVFLKIGGLSRGSRVMAATVEEFSHMMVAHPLGKREVDVTSQTHPSLAGRVRALLPTWDGTYPKIAPLRPPIWHSTKTAALTADCSGAPAKPQEIH